MGDFDIGIPSDAPDIEQVTSVDEGTEHLRSKIDDLIAAVSGTIVSCPVLPIEIPGITAADALDANDCMGTLFTIDVPKRGVIISATFWDMDDEGTQVDFEIFKHSVIDTANDAAFAPTDADLLEFITELAFFAFDDHGTGQTSDIKNIGKAYSAPEGKFYIKAVTRSTPTIAAGNVPRLQLQIQSFDSDFKEA